jgi:hypothetical protein
MTKEDKNGIYAVVIVTVLGVAMYLSYRYFHLKKTEETYAIFIGDNRPSTASVDYFKYKNSDGKVYEVGCAYASHLEIGDTVWIKYSTTDPTLIEVLDKDFEKYMPRNQKN